MNNKTFNTYILKVMKNTNADLGLSLQYKKDLNSLLFSLGRKLGQTAVNFTEFNNMRTVSSLHVQRATATVLPRTLTNSAVGFATKAVTAFTAFSKKGTKSVTNSAKAGLVFPVTFSRTFFGATSHNVSQTASVYMAAVLEHVCRQLNQKTSVVTVNNKKKTLTNRFLFLAVSEDDDMTQLTKTLNMEFLGTGAVENLPESLTVKNKTSRRKKAAKTGHRWLPGTVALRKIKQLQKNDDDLLQKTPFNRALRSVAAVYKTDLMFSQEAVSALHQYVENATVKFLTRVRDLALYAGRQTVSLEDMQTLARLDGLNTTLEAENKDVQSLSNPGLRRLGYRAGVKRMSESFYEGVKGYMEHLLNGVFRVVPLVLGTRKVVNGLVLKNTLSLEGVDLVFTPERKVKNAKKKVES